MRSKLDQERDKLGMPEANKEFRVEPKRTITFQFTEEEFRILTHILWHFSDYVNGDDRPDHGLGILKGYREYRTDNSNKLLLNLAGRLEYKRRKLK